MIFAYGKSKDLPKRTQSDKFKVKVFEIANDRKYDGYQRWLASMVYKFFDKKSSGSGVATEPVCGVATITCGWTWVLEDTSTQAISIYIKCKY